ncbi:MAG: histidine phosphatase family protein [Verrucomicrobiae bacterium]
MRKSFVRHALVVAVFLLAGFGAQAEEPLKVYYVRHAQGGHNVALEWKGIPKDQWPPYVGNPDAFTPLGEAQVAELTKKLDGMKFDFVASSPTWRTRNTILPYLRLKNLKAEIWPELMETPFVGPSVPADLPAPTAALFEGTVPLKISDSEKEFFDFRADGRNEIQMVPESNAAQYTSDSIALAEKTAQMVRTRFGKSGKTILLVGHGLAGTTLIRVLTGSTVPQHGLSNTKLWMAEEQPDGSFKLKMMNNVPYEK